MFMKYFHGSTISVRKNIQIKHFFFLFNQSEGHYEELYKVFWMNILWGIWKKQCFDICIYLYLEPESAHFQYIWLESIKIWKAENGQICKDKKNGLYDYKHTYILPL